MVKVGDIVKVNVLKYQGFRGTIVSIDDGMATIEVPTYYGDKDPVIIYQDVRYLDKAPETLKELENLKIKRRR
jgi:hypothetical protein